MLLYLGSIFATVKRIEMYMYLRYINENIIIIIIKQDQLIQIVI